MIRLYILFILSFYCLLVQSQENNGLDVWVKIYVSDKTDGRPVENAQVISYETMQVYATDSLGMFRSVFKQSDSLKVFGLGYDGVVVKVEQFKNRDEGIELRLTRRTYMIRSVNVAAKQELHLHLPDDIKLAKKSDKDKPIALRSDVYSRKPPVLAAVINPISYVYYFTSKKEKMKRNGLKALAKSKDQDKINVFFNKEIIKEVSEYKEGEKLNEFIVYCNVNLKVASNDNHLIVKHRIMKLKEKFEAEFTE